MRKDDPDRPLTIGVVIRNFNTAGGAEKYAVEIARRMAARGHHVHIIAREIDGDSAQGMRRHVIPKQAAYSSVVSLWRYGCAAGDLTGRIAFDVVHAHEKGYSGDVTTVHTFPFIHGIERLSLLKKLNRFYLSPRAGLYHWLERKQLQSTGVVAVSDLVRRDIQRYFPHVQTVHVVNPGVDVDMFMPPAPTGMPGSGDSQAQAGVGREMRVLFVGSEFHRKGLDRLIMALPEQARLIVVGSGDHHARIHRLVATAGLEGRVDFEGLVDDVTAYYSAADVLVLPSRREAFGMAALEAMACGLPVIVSVSAGVADLIVDGQNGYLSSGPVALQSILQKLLDPLVRKRIGANARRTAVDHTWDKCADQYESIYRDVWLRKRRKAI